MIRSLVGRASTLRSTATEDGSRRSSRRTCLSRKTDVPPAPPTSLFSVAVAPANGARLVPSRSGLAHRSALEGSLATSACAHAAEWDTPRSAEGARRLRRIRVGQSQGPREIPGRRKSVEGEAACPSSVAELSTLRSSATAEDGLRREERPRSSRKGSRAPNTYPAAVAGQAPALRWVTTGENLRAPRRFSGPWPCRPRPLRGGSELGTFAAWVGMFAPAAPGMGALRSVPASPVWAQCGSWCQQAVASFLFFGIYVNGNRR